jgi:hypothetical protein
MPLVVCLLLPGAADALAHGKEAHRKKTGLDKAPVAAEATPASAAAEETLSLVGDGDTANSPISAAIETIAHNYLVDIKHIFRQACFDCHTSLTEYPWYYSLPGIKDMIDSDIEDGREHLDFSNDYPFLSHAPLTDDLRAIGRVIQDNSMPPIQYRVIHWSQALEPEQKAKVLRWVEDSLAQLGNAGYVAAAAD